MKIEPAFYDNNIVVICSSDEKYVPYLSTLLYSIMDHISVDNNYDILILEDSISDKNKNIIQRIISNKKNVSIRFVNMKKYTNGEDQKWKSPNIEKWPRSIYYRMLIPYIFSEYEKVIYLDCDIINLCDIAEMYKIEIGDCLVGAVRLLGMVNVGKNNMLNSTYLLTTAMLPEIKIGDYFNSGVLIINIQKFRKKYSKESILKFINDQNYNLPDQDSLNVLCSNQVKYIDAGWNCYPYTKQELNNVLKVCPEDLKEYYREGYLHIKNIHYTTTVKPWLEPYGEYSYSSSFFWKYAFVSPYIDLIYSNMHNYLLKKENSIYVIRKTWNELREFSKCNKLVLYGYGVRGKEFLELYGREIVVVGFYDKDKQKKTENSKLSFVDLPNINKNDREEIGVLISNDGWENIADELIDWGYRKQFAYKCLSLRDSLAWRLRTEDFLKAEFIGNILEDEQSRQIYWTLIQKRERRTYDRNLRCMDIYEGNSYFRDDIYCISDNEIYVDVGSYRGVTINKFIEYVGGNYNKIFAFEMDEENYINLIENCKFKNVIIHNIALDDVDGVKRYNRNNLNTQLERSGMYSVDGYQLDTVLSNEKITFIKVNVNNAKSVIWGG